MSTDNQTAPADRSTVPSRIISGAANSGRIQTALGCLMLGLWAGATVSTFTDPAQVPINNINGFIIGVMFAIAIYNIIVGAIRFARE